MEEPFGGAMAMDERSYHPHLAVEGQRAGPGAGARSGGSGVTGGAASKQPDADWESGPARAKRPVKETVCDAITS